MRTKLLPLTLAAMSIAAPLTPAAPRRGTAQTLTARSAAAQDATAQTAPAPAAWTALASLPPGARLRVTMKSGEKLEAAFDGADAERLTVIVGKRRQQIERDEVRSIHRVRGSIAKAALIGAGVGAGAGAGIGAAAGGVVTDGFADGTSRGTAALGGAALFGGIGAGVGALVGSARRKRTLIYEAP